MDTMMIVNVSAFFQNAIIEMLKAVDFIPDVIQCNDYHTAMIPFLLQEKYNYDGDFSNIRTLLTIHNIEFQGVYGLKFYRICLV